VVAVVVVVFVAVVVVVVVVVSSHSAGKGIVGSGYRLGTQRSVGHLPSANTMHGSSPLGTQSLMPPRCGGSATAHAVLGHTL